VRKKGRKEEEEEWEEEEGSAEPYSAPCRPGFGR
jgi:hypothetical protein